MFIELKNIRFICIKRILFLLFSNSGKDSNLKIMTENVLTGIASMFFGILAINIVGPVCILSC